MISLLRREVQPRPWQVAKELPTAHELGSLGSNRKESLEGCLQIEGLLHSIVVAAQDQGMVLQMAQQQQGKEPLNQSQHQHQQHQQH